MRICIVSYHSSPLEPAGSGKSGGMNVFISHLYRKLAHSCEVDIFVCGDKGRITLGPGIQVIHIRESNLRDFAEQIITYHSIRHYDLMHTHYWLSGIVGLLTKEVLKIPWVHSLHTFEILKGIQKDQVRIEVENEIIRKCDVVISPTHREAAVMRHTNPRTHVITIPHGVDTNRFKPSANGHSTLLYIGRIDPIKGLDLLVDALRYLRREIWLNIVGGSSKGKDNLESIKTYATGLPVHFLGPVKFEELYKCYSNAAMIIVPSYYESFGLVGLEAMASARPVIGFVDTGLSETVGQDAGILVKRNARTLAQAISCLFNNQTLRHNLGLQGRKKALTYSWEAISRQYYTIYEEIIKK